MAKKDASPAADKLNYKRTTLIGFGFMACMLFWNVYNSYVPVIFRAKLTELLPGFMFVPLLVNAIMTIDNVFGVIFQPYFGKRSDRMRSEKWGKRMPFILVCLPICAVLFTLIPVAATVKQSVLSIILMMSVIICFNFIMSIWRSPVVSLMPDFTPSHLQSDANAVINIMGGVGQMFGLVIGKVAVFALGLFSFNATFSALHDSLSAKTDTLGRILATVDPATAPLAASSGATPLIEYSGVLANGIPDQYRESVQNFIDSSRDALYFNGTHFFGEAKEGATLVAQKMALQLPDGTYQYVNYTPIFLVAAIIAILCLLVLVAFYKRNKKYDLSDSLARQKGEDEEAAKKKIKIRDLPISKEERRSLIVMLAALFLINNATEAIVPNFTNFALDTLNLPPTSSTLMMAVFAVSLAVFGIPAGKLGRKLGRKKTIMIGLGAIVVMFIIYLAVSQIFAGSKTFVWIVLWIALIVGGAAVGCVNINTLPLVLTIGGRDYVGTFTGYYYTATFSAAITGPLLCGLLVSLFHGDYNYMFLFCAIFFALGFAVITQVKHGESFELTEEELKQAQMADD
ncbi:MAG: MFS transporter [Clostridia bacterium]|nr:MFS transporter [Clostridia bacterium]MBR0510334.1 MFS transporter [Clostridia bacterium]